MRSFQDINKLKKKLEKKLNSSTSVKNNSKKNTKIVIVGASFIGMETASALKAFCKENAEISIIDPS
jgi:NADH dehydrogenase FAD-containing subunit